MKRDGKLVWRLQNLPKDVKEKNNIEALIEEYEIATILSSGPDPNRCAHWEKKAAIVLRKVEKVLIDHPVPEPAKKKEPA